MVTMDFIKELGAMAIGSRLKRLTMRMNKDVSRTYRELGIDFKARWFPVALILYKKSPLAVTEIADSLNYTHTAIKNFANEMVRIDLIESIKDESDGRKRLLQLTPEGIQTVKNLQPIWHEIQKVAQDLANFSDPNIIASIESIEKQLDEKEVYDRIRERLKESMLNNIKIEEYKPAYKAKFKALNCAWLEKYFKVERNDEVILSDPKGQVLEKGGIVLFARLGNRVGGTVALIRHEYNVFELSRMAVEEKSRHHFVGTKLTMEIIMRAEAMGAKSIYLETHPKLKPSISLYEKMGFNRISHGPIPPMYKRRRIIMRFDFKNLHK